MLLPHCKTLVETPEASRSSLWTSEATLREQGTKPWRLLRVCCGDGEHGVLLALQRHFPTGKIVPECANLVHKPASLISLA